MPALNTGSDFSAGGLATSASVNAKFQAIKDLLNTTKLDKDNIQALAIITSLINDGAVTAQKLDPAVLAAIGVNDPSNVRRGKSIIPTEESRTNTSYGFMATHDVVSSIVLPTNGLLHISYHAMWKESVSTAGRAAIFIGLNQLKLADGGTQSVQAAITSDAGHPPAANTYRLLATAGVGLVSNPSNAYSGDVTTGQVVGFGGGTGMFELGSTATNLGGYGTPSDVWVFAAAGTYDISVQFKSSSGSVTAENRKLWVEAVGF